MLAKEAKLFMAISNAIRNKVIDGITVEDLLEYEVISYSPWTVAMSDMELWTNANISAIIKGFTIRDGERFNINKLEISMLHLSLQYDQAKEEFSVEICKTEW